MIKAHSCSAGYAVAIDETSQSNVIVGHKMLERHFQLQCRLSLDSTTYYSNVES